MKDVYVLVIKCLKEKTYYRGFSKDGYDCVSTEISDAVLFQDRNIAVLANKSLASDYYIEKRTLHISI